MAGRRLGQGAGVGQEGVGKMCHSFLARKGRPASHTLHTQEAWEALLPSRLGSELPEDQPGQEGMGKDATVDSRRSPHLLLCSRVRGTPDLPSHL